MPDSQRNGCNLFPGTAACSAGQFFCRNRGHVPLSLNSSFVDDGICDCCDGSDEAPGRCQNTCTAAGAAAREALQASLKEHIAGSRLRERLLRAAVATKKDWRSRLAVVQSEEAAWGRKLEALAEKKRVAEESETRAREAKQAADKVAEEARIAAAPPSDILAPAPSEQETEAPEPETADPAAETADPAASDVEAGLAAATEDAAAGGESDEELAAKRMSQWVKGGDDEGATADAEEASESGESVMEAADEVVVEPTEAGEGEEEVLEEEVLAEEKATGVLSKLGAWMRSLMHKRPDASASELDVASSAAEKARAAWADANGKHSELSSERSGLETKLGRDSGPDDIFIPLEGRCISANVEKYEYEVCPFGKSAQKEGGSSTSLGDFLRFENDFKLMIFGNGQGCWAGPPRSMAVTLVCGTEEKLMKVEEPSRCQYSAELAIPALCTPQDVARLQLEADRAEAEAAGMHNEL